MSIETIGSFKEILNNHKTENWLKSTNLDLNVKGFNEISVDKTDSGKSFGEILMNKVADVNNQQVQANQAIEKLVTGQSRDIEGTLMTMEKAMISLQMLNQVRSKVIDAYREVMRMQV